MKRKASHSTIAYEVNVFEHETEIVAAAAEVERNNNIDREEIYSRYKILVKEYKKLLRKTQKITRIGDSNQRKLLAAYDKIEAQNTQLDRAREEADRANKAKSSFLARMSHEIRTPMNAILGMTELTLLTSLNEEQQDYLETVKEAGQSLLIVINDILDFSKIEAQQLTLESIDFNLKDALRSTIKMLVIDAAKKGIELNFHISSDVPLILKGDPDRLKQIIFNLAGNAIKFTREGEITVEVKTCDMNISTTTDRISLLFSIRDTGIGIPEDKQKVIFDSFSQADSSTTRKYGGTGLGLAICKQLAELMGGAIWMESAIGKGSVFNFTAVFQPGIPEVAAILQKQEDVSNSQGEPLRILLVEDNPMNAKLALIFLKRHQHYVIHAHNGLEALELLKKESVDLIFMDLEMPEMDGYEASYRIRNDKSGVFNPNVPIIAMTAHSLPEYREKIFQSGMTDYITKPVSLQKLTRLLARINPQTRASDTEYFHTPTALQELPGQQEQQEISGIGKILNQEAALKRLDGDMSLYRKFCRMFLEEIPEIREKLNLALSNQDFTELRKCAHYLKGSAAMIGAEIITHYAAHLEKSSREKKDMEDVCRLLKLVEEGLTMIKKVLEKMGQGQDMEQKTGDFEIQDL